MMIRPETDELAMMVAIALKTAPAYALRNVMVGKGKFDRATAVETLTARVIAACPSSEHSAHFAA